MDIERRIANAGGTLTPAERRVAEIVLAQPQRLAYATVSALAAEASAGAASVVRLANKLGFDGFSAMQAAAQRELSSSLRPAAARIKDGVSSPTVQRHEECEVGNIAVTLGAVHPGTLEKVVGKLASPKARVYVVSGDASRGVAHQFVHDLDALRPEVTLVEGNEVAVQRQIASMRASDVLVCIDLRRYDRWVVDALGAAAAVGVWCVAVTDSVLSPLASRAQVTFTVRADADGPFDSHVGTLALLNLFVAGTAVAARRTAAVRLERAESRWRTSDVLTDG